MRQRFLDQGRDASVDALERIIHVELIGGGKNNAVGTILGEHVTECLIERHASFPRHGGGSRSGINNGGQGAGFARLNQLDMATPDQTRTCYCNSVLAHLISPSPSCCRLRVSTEE